MLLFSYLISLVELKLKVSLQYLDSFLSRLFSKQKGQRRRFPVASSALSSSTRFTHGVYVILSEMKVPVVMKLYISKLHDVVSATPVSCAGFNLIYTYFTLCIIARFSFVDWAELLEACHSMSKPDSP